MMPLLGLVLITCVVLSLRIHYLDKKESESSDDFWSREQKANTTVKTNIADLPYLTIPIDKFPTDFMSDPEAVRLNYALIALSKEPILNLNHMTNTDLKLNFGANNFKKMQAIGENYNKLIICLKDYAAILKENGRLNDAIRVLEYGVEIKSDISANYTMLADLYLETNQPERIKGLISTIHSMDLVLEQSILKYLYDSLEKAGLTVETPSTSETPIDELTID